MLNPIMSILFGCFGFHGHQRSKKPIRSQKGTASRDSPLSMSVPGASVPHALDSPDALRKIFASNSSSRGYNAVKPVPKHPVGQGSLDLGFRFGTESPRKRRHGRLEQLTHHVKQTLSESRLSRNDEHTKDSATAPIQLSTTHRQSEPEATSQPLSRSDKSLGLTDLLTSRAASEGGYDSDARSMQTPMLYATGTNQISSRLVRKSLATIEGSQNEEPVNETTEVSKSAPSATSSPVRGVSESPCSLRVPKKISLSAALRIGSNESPSDVLRRVSNGIANGAIQIPDTPQLRAVRMSSMGKSESEWRFSMSVPERMSSLRDRDLTSIDEPGDPDLNGSLRILAEFVELAKRESMVPGEERDLLSELNPALVSYLEKVNYSCRHRSNDDNAAEESPPMTVIKVNTKQKTGNTNTTETVEPSIKKISEIAKSEVGSAESSRAQSLHLFNMRISQRLESGSRIPVLSSASQSNNNSTGGLAISHPIKLDRASSKGRRPTFIAIEHNRRPSDPTTKKIFEVTKSAKVPAGATQPAPLDNSQPPDGLTAESVPTVDDSGSYYGSVQEDNITGGEIPCIPVRSGSLKNPNSLAIGGRSASGPTQLQRATSRTRWPQDVTGSMHRAVSPPRQLSKSYRGFEAVQGRSQGRSVSLPKPSKFIKVDTTPTPVARNLEQTTEANEDMSEINVDHVLQNGKVLMGSESTQAAEDRRNENFSGTDISDTAIWNNDTISRRAWRNNAWISDWNLNSTNTPGQQRLDASVDSRGNRTTSKPSMNEDEADDLWHKAFKRLAEPNDYGKLLATPRFDCEGRRKSSVTSTSENDRLRVPLSDADGRSRSADSGRPKPLYTLQTDKHRRRSVPILRHSDFNLVKGRQLARKLKKSSMVSLRRATANTALSTGTKKKRRDDEGLGIWARFASHTRDERNGPAGSDDDVKVRDFSKEDPVSQQPTTPVSRKSSSSFDIRRPESWKIVTTKRSMLKPRGTRSMTFGGSSAERAKRRRKGMVGKLRKLYRTKSSEIHALASTQGHRGSTSVGLTAEYPELESLPGEGSFAATPVQFQIEMGVDDLEEEDISRDVSLDTISEVTSKRSKSTHSHTLPWTKRDAEEWSKLYQDCVGSFSALQSDDNIAVARNKKSGKEKRVLSLASALGESTTNFEADLMQENNRARQESTQRLESSDETVRELIMPGTFV